MPELPSPALTVAEVLQRWPQASEVFLQRRLACAGCAMAPFDTLGEVASAYRLDLSTLLDELGRVANGDRHRD